MRERNFRVPIIAAVALGVALGGLYAGASRDRPQQAPLIKCAAVALGSPCGPDPSMERLGFPPYLSPLREVRPTHPIFLPAR